MYSGKYILTLFCPNIKETGIWSVQSQTNNSQGSVATCFRCGGILMTASLPNLLHFENRSNIVKIWTKVCVGIFSTDSVYITNFPRVITAMLLGDRQRRISKQVFQAVFFSSAPPAGCWFVSIPGLISRWGDGCHTLHSPRG